MLLLLKLLLLKLLLLKLTLDNDSFEHCGMSITLMVVLNIVAQKSTTICRLHNALILMGCYTTVVKTVQIHIVNGYIVFEG